MQTILYIPGLGDEHTTKWLVNRWEKPNREVVTFSTKWSERESYADKFTRLEKLYKSIKDKGDIQVIAVSAGGSLATRLVRENSEISSLKLVSCKIKGSATIGESFQKRAPALLDAVKASEDALDSVHEFEQKTTAYRPIYEWTVPLKDMTYGNFKKRRVPAIGHPLGIGITLLFYVP